MAGTPWKEPGGCRLTAGGEAEDLPAVYGAASVPICCRRG